ncbi:hypothetical protein CEXT_119321 [Caerostris extrusa]|uniref:Uncharacterized protein n=1 Tax=Caerostris extrusa TaxID=172846 RepID=A0AAV4MS28_CAEEX|nr:hypothetical protein CEXT_119321 [Caerostris extrusa]
MLLLIFSSDWNLHTTSSSIPVRLEPAYYVFPPDPSDWNLHTTSSLQTRPTGTCILRLPSRPVRLEPAYYVFLQTRPTGTCILRLPSRPVRLEPAYYAFPPDPGCPKALISRTGCPEWLP